jgi:hypothetical protein
LNQEASTPAAEVVAAVAAVAVEEAAVVEVTDSRHPS